ncbi:hypothetical protein [Liquorilactobacillus oeni]|uniref:Uncharacterized protein n=1 Tax=Liquorilactobacillus oeni DSM 19972 TaxID=1423777 RepID=A0A0R1MBL5_9LACO|nr:hypothetical protein [Liquorilactobacillus oeni]KRL05623.1 hypothetical protein FD46_GL000367 [Liquorilactobacillus oeni DSM 19972]
MDGTTVFDNDDTLGQIYLMSEQNLYSESERLRKLFKTTELLYGSFDHSYAVKLANEFSLDFNQKVWQTFDGLPQYL